MVVGRSYQHTELVQLTDSTHFSHLTWLRFHSLDSSHTLPPSPPLPSLLIIPHLTPIIFHTTHITQLISHIPQLTNSSFTQLITHTTHPTRLTHVVCHPSPYATDMLQIFSFFFLHHCLHNTKATHVGLSGPLIFGSLFPIPSRNLTKLLKMAIEINRNHEFSHYIVAWWIFPVRCVNVYQRVYTNFLGQSTR